MARHLIKTLDVGSLFILSVSTDSECGKGSSAQSPVPIVLLVPFVGLLNSLTQVGILHLFK